MKFPFLKPSPPKLSERVSLLEEIEASQRFSNFGPKASAFEAQMAASFGPQPGTCLTVANATLGLMIAIREALERGPTAQTGAPRYAIVPSFTFAATAHALLWNSLTPLYCDVDAETWLPDPASIESLLRAYAGKVALIVPYATFGNSLDLAWYEALERKSGVPVVVDAAASLGSLDAGGRPFGSGSTLPIVFSMHATKTFATAEAGLIYARDASRIATLRAMSNFGFSAERVVVMPGLNAKLSELGALLALEKHAQMPSIVAQRQALAAAYRAKLPGLPSQRWVGTPTFQFFPALLPDSAPIPRATFLERMAAAGVEVRSYFSPCLHEQAWFAARSEAPALPVTEALSRSVLSFPLYDSMGSADIDEIARLVGSCLA